MRQLLILFACLAMLLCAGCESGRPICGATLCVDGRVLLKSELADGEYDSVSVDESGLLAFLGKTPEPITPPNFDTLTVADIVSDTTAGGQAYEGKILTVNGTVKKRLDSGTLTLVTGDEDILFFVNSLGTEERLSTYQVGQSYDFHVYLHDQQTGPETTRFDWIIWSHLVATAEPQRVTLDTLNTHAKARNQQYQGTVITLTATISTVLDSVMFLRDNEIGVSFSIRRSGHPAEAQYQSGESYTLTAFVIKIGESVIGSEVLLGLLHE